LQAVAAVLHDSGHFAPVLLPEYAPAILPRSRWSFSPVFLPDVLPVWPAGGCLLGLLFLRGFFHGNFSRKKAPEKSALFWAVDFSGAAVFMCPSRLRSVSRTMAAPVYFGTRRAGRKFPAIFPAGYFMRAV